MKPLICSNKELIKSSANVDWKRLISAGGSTLALVFCHQQNQNLVICSSLVAIFETSTDETSALGAFSKNLLDPI